MSSGNLKEKQKSDKHWANINIILGLLFLRNISGSNTNNLNLSNI